MLSATAHAPCIGLRTLNGKCQIGTPWLSIVGPNPITRQPRHLTVLSSQRTALHRELCDRWRRLTSLAGQNTACQRCRRRKSTPRAMQTTGDNHKTHVLFVCLGNICRSPTAEAVFNAVVQKAGRANSFVVDSCGTGGGNPAWYERGGWSYHEGDPSDPRMLEAARKRGVHLTSRSRPLTPEDFSNFDYIIGMDGENLRAITTAAEYWRPSSPGIPVDYQGKIKLMTDSLQSKRFASYSHVPDPYYGGAEGFDVVLDLLEDACQGLLAEIEA